MVRLSLYFKIIDIHFYIQVLNLLQGFCLGIAIQNSSKNELNIKKR